MKFSIRHLLSRFFVETKSSTSVREWLRGDERDESAPILRNAFAQSVWVYDCVTVIADQVAQIPFRFSICKEGENLGAGQNSGRTQRGFFANRAALPLVRARPSADAQLDPLVALFAQPHPTLTKYLFWELLVSWLLLRGEAFVLPLDAKHRPMPLDRSRSSILPASLLVLNPDRVRRVVQHHQLAGYRYQASNVDPYPTTDFLPEELLVIRLANPVSPLEGFAPATVALLAAQTDYASAQFMKGLILNNADTGLIVTTDKALAPEQVAQLQAALRERKRRAGSADRPLFLTETLSVEKPSLSAVDLQFLENRKFNRQEICSIFRVPQEILGYTEDANRSVSETARLNFIENRIAPLCERLADAFVPLANLFARDGARICPWFDIECLPIMQKARRERFASARQAFEMGVPIDVCDQLFDLGLPEDLPHKGKSFLPRNLQPQS